MNELPMNEVHEGGCLCGAVRYRASGTPARVFACHCSFCKRAFGTAFSLLAFFKADRVAFNDAARSVYDYRSPSHGRTLHLQSCPVCSTRVGLTAERLPGIHAVCVGTLDEPNRIRVGAHLWLGSALDWMTFPPDVACYERTVVTEQGAPEQPLPAQSRPWQLAEPSR
jgi:hypothetical protein